MALAAGRTYSIADIALFPWLRSWKNQGVALAEILFGGTQYRKR